MTVTTENSVEMGKLEGAIPKPVETHQLHGRLRLAFFDFTQGAANGDAGSIARLTKLPHGKVRVILPLSRVYFEAMGTSRTMDLGHEAYTQLDGTAVAADENDLDDGVDVSSAGNVTPGGTIGTHETKVFDSREGVVITAQINDGTLPATKKISGYLVYVVD